MLKNREINMSRGSLLKQIILCAIPLMCSNVLQVLFNAADVAVLMLFAGEVAEDAVGAVGSTGALIHLIIELFVGLAVGANVMVARAVGENNPEKAEKTVGTAIAASLVVGVFLMIVGYFGAGTFLTWMGCTPALLPMATTYLEIYFLGMPVIMLYNFSSAILRSVGDTTRPLIYLALGGIFNIGLNILFVVGFHKTVEGVAIATVASNAVSAILCVITLLRNRGFSRLKPSCIRFHGKELLDIIRVGIPAGIQGCVFSLSNVIIQSGLHSLGKEVVSGNTLAYQFDGVVYQAVAGFVLSTVVFVSQNYGARNFPRIRRTVRYSLLLTGGLGLLLGTIILAIAHPVLSLLTDNQAVLDAATMRLTYMGSSFFLCGIVDTMSQTMRGLGKSTLAMVVTLFGTCVLRVIWMTVFFPMEPFHNLQSIYIAYPISRGFTLCIFLVLYFPTMKRLERRYGDEKAELSAPKNVAKS